MSELIFVKPLTAVQIQRRAAYARLMASCKVTPNTKLLHDQPTKQQPASARFATI